MSKFLEWLSGAFVTLVAIVLIAACNGCSYKTTDVSNDKDTTESVYQLNLENWTLHATKTIMSSDKDTIDFTKKSFGFN